MCSLEFYKEIQYFEYVWKLFIIIAVSIPTYYLEQRGLGSEFKLNFIASSKDKIKFFFSSGNLSYH